MTKETLFKTHKLIM